MRRWILIGALALASMFCSANLSDPATPTPDVDAMVAATLTAFAASTATAMQTVAPLPAGPAATETLSTTPMSSFPETGYITGTLTYPAERVPPLRVVAFPVGGGAPAYTDTVADQSTYMLELPVGVYHVVAYTISGDGFPSGLSGGYTQSVPCGLSVDCSDHSLIDVNVTVGATTSGVDPGDWYAPEGTFPPMPGP